MKIEIELSERRLEKAGFTYEAAANTIKAAFKRRGASILTDDVSLVFEGDEKKLSGAVNSLKKMEWFTKTCVLCEEIED